MNSLNFLYEKTYSYNRLLQRIDLDSHSRYMYIQMYGAKGGNNKNNNGTPGEGGFTEAFIYIPNNIASYIYLLIGESGNTNINGNITTTNFGGGGIGDKNGAGCGGGRTCIYYKNKNHEIINILVAGGGGGTCYGGNPGSNGGGLSSINIENNGMSGTQKNGGKGNYGSNGEKNNGGNGYNENLLNPEFITKRGGGGGGGGYYGGGGGKGGPYGGESSGGGGGSSYAGNNNGHILYGSEGKGLGEYGKSLISLYNSESIKTNDLILSSDFIYYKNRILLRGGGNGNGYIKIRFYK